MGGLNPLAGGFTFDSPVVVLVHAIEQDEAINIGVFGGIAARGLQPGASRTGSRDAARSDG